MAKKLLILAITVFASLIWVLNDDNIAHTKSATPPLKKTGAPGHSKCSECHDGGAGGSVSITFGNGDTHYVAGQTYEMQVTVTSTTMVRFGFEMICFDAAKKPVGTWVATGSNTQVIGSGSYIAHQDALVGTSPHTFNFQWIAPPEGTGTVTFYVGGVAANNNDSSTGDGGYTKSKTITEIMLPGPDTYSYVTGLNTSTAQCVPTNELQGVLVNTIFCDGTTTTTTSNNGTVNIDAASGFGCFTYTPASGFLGTDQFCILVCDNNIPQVCDTTTVNIQVVPYNPVFKAKVFLEGAYAAGLMNTKLQQANLLPLSQPYSGAPWNYAGTEMVTSFAPNIVDWVLIELRYKNDTSLASQKAALLRDDGMILDLDNNEGVLMGNNLIIGDYFMVIRHRNHLPIISEVAHNLTLNTAVYNFTIGTEQAMGTNQLTQIDTDVWGMRGGDIDAKGTITVSDFNIYQLDASKLNLYIKSDITLDKAVTVADFNKYKPNSGWIAPAVLRY